MTETIINKFRKIYYSESKNISLNNNNNINNNKLTNKKNNISNNKFINIENLNYSKLNIKDLGKLYNKYKKQRKIINYKKINLNNKELIYNKSFIIIIPYRDDKKHVRKKHLNIFIDKIPKLFNNLNCKFKILIVEQNNKKNRFNRGYLLNIGFDISKNSFDYFIFHDIDLIPDLDLVPYYNIYPFKPIHLANVWKKYNLGGKYFGGVNSFNKKDFIKINGYPNNYWGWGGEDDELYDRLSENNLEFLIPNKGKYTELKHNKPTKNNILSPKQKMILRLKHKNTWENNGINNLNYELLNINKIKKNISLISVKF